MTRRHRTGDTIAARRRGARLGGLTPAFVLAIGTFAIGTEAFIVAGLVPQVARSLDSSVATVGQVVTVFALAYAIGSPLLTTLTARVPRRPLLVGSLALFALVNVLCAVSPTILALAGFLLALWRGTLATSLLYVAVWGVVGWGTVPPQQHRLVRSAGAGASIALSLNASALYLGIGLGGLIGGYVVAAQGPGGLWLAAGVLGALALLLLPVSASAERRAAAG
jgi:MFS transporter, DHA1 family, inner membrane transport protein